MKLTRLFMALPCLISFYTNAQTPWDTSTSGQITYTGGKVGIGTSSPDAQFHLQVSNFGIKSAYSDVIIESNDAYLDLISSSDATWGSSLNFIEGNGALNTDMWSIIRQTSSGSGNSSLHFKYGTNNNPTSNSSRFTLTPSGHLGLGTQTPGTLLDVRGTISFGGAGNQRLFVVSGENDGEDLILHNAQGSRHQRIKLIDGNTSLPMGFAFDTSIDAGSNWDRPFVISDGNVGIGTTSPSEKLEVNGTIRSKEVKVEATGWPDYVFEPNYSLRTLEETEAYIKENKHLPEVPSATEMEANGVQLGEMNMLLLKKIEELTLYVIELKKENQKQQNQIEKLISDRK